ncbi:MAG: glycosyltransferase [Leptolyngbyaceae cyanobacterium bins.349]|nr:glycosyltransferase [Leptolyngbyaceae cyanobacterium bins.349]
MSQPLVSVIVPTYNSAEYVEGCLKSIQEQSYAHIELIVVDNNSSDRTKEIAARYTPQVYNAGPERSAQRNVGFDHSKGAYALFIDSDMVLSPQVVEACVTKILASDRIKALIIPEESFGIGFWAQCKRLERSFYSGIDWQEAARFFERKVYEELGGYDENQTGSEDYDLPNRLENQYGHESISRVLPLIYHNERNLNLVRSCRKKFYYARTLKGYLHQKANHKRISKQISILNRYAVFFAKPKKLFYNPILGLGMLFMKTCEFASGTAGFLVSRKA